MWTCIQNCCSQLYEYILSYFQHKVDSQYSLLVIQQNRIFQSVNNDYRYHMRERFIYFPLDSCRLEGKTTFKITHLNDQISFFDRVFIDFKKQKPKEMLYHTYRYHEYRFETQKGSVFQIRIPLTKKFPPYLLYQFKE